MSRWKADENRKGSTQARAQDRDPSHVIQLEKVFSNWFITKPLTEDIMGLQVMKTVFSIRGCAMEDLIELDIGRNTITRKIRKVRSGTKTKTHVLQSNSDIITAMNEIRAKICLQINSCEQFKTANPDLDVLPVHELGSDIDDIVYHVELWIVKIIEHRLAHILMEWNTTFTWFSFMLLFLCYMYLCTLPDIDGFLDLMNDTHEIRDADRERFSESGQT